ncbi:MAG: hypothetical protein IJE89_03390 [Bacilli bacterium]|nr:hypothetical protein [Bacilli bacterium]
MSYYKNSDGIGQDMMSSDSFFRGHTPKSGPYTEEEVREYLDIVVSGTMIPGASECGKMYVSFEKLKELVDEGYNIIRLLNPEDVNPHKIYIEYQKCDKVNNNKHGR